MIVEFPIVTMIYLGFSWCIQPLVLEKNCAFWILWERLIWYDSCCTNLVFYSCCDLIYYDVVVVYSIPSMIYLCCCDLFEFCHISVALWVERFYKFCCCTSNTMTNVWCNMYLWKWIDDDYIVLVLIVMLSPCQIPYPPSSLPEARFWQLSLEHIGWDFVCFADAVG